MERFAKQAAKALNQVLPKPLSESQLEIPPNPNLGDFAYPCFKLSKELRKSPPQIAEWIVSELHSKSLVPPHTEIKATGPYVNFKTAPGAVLGALLGDILKGDGLGEYGMLPTHSRRKWVLEYSSPNIARPLMIHHLRPTALGAALDRIGRFRGFHVISINHLGDWGKQYGWLAVAFRHFGKSANDPLTMRDLVDLYVKINAEGEKNSELENEARQAFAKLEQGDPEIAAIWKKCVAVSNEAFDETYEKLGVRFDHVWGESYYKELLKPLIQNLKEKGLLIQSEGAWVVPVTTEDDKELPPCIIEKSDGSTIYATRDLAAAIYRHQKFAFDRMTYIVGAEQKLHFQQVFAVLKKMGFEWASRCEHIPFGLYRFNDSKMSTRRGIFVTLEDVLALAESKVRELMTERAENADDQTPPREDIIRSVAVGALVFHDLHTDPARDVDFDVGRVVDFEGETGPYLQYAHTRCQSILRKATEAGLPAVAFDQELVSQLKADQEIALTRMLGRLPLHLERSLEFSKASQLAHYLIDVTKTFGQFYRECRVLPSDEVSTELSRARLMLVEATRRVLARGLILLGVPLPERM